MSGYTFAGAITLLALIVGLFLKLYPKVRAFIDTEDSKFRAEYAKFFATKMFDLEKEHQSVWDSKRKQWVSSIPSVQDIEKFTIDVMESSDKLWKNVRKARKLRDNLDMVIVSLIIGVITFFIFPLIPTQILSNLIAIIDILATIIGLLILFFYVIRKLY